MVGMAGTIKTKETKGTVGHCTWAMSQLLKLLQAFLHKMVTYPEEDSGCFDWISTNPCSSKSCLYSVTVRSLPWVCTSMFRDCGRVLLGPVLFSFKNLSATRRPPPDKTQQIKLLPSIMAGNKGKWLKKLHSLFYVLHFYYTLGVQGLLGLKEKFTQK